MGKLLSFHPFKGEKEGIKMERGKGVEGRTQEDRGARWGRDEDK